MMSSNETPGGRRVKSAPFSARPLAIARMGLPPGRNWTIRQDVPAVGINPRYSAGRSPQLTSEDLPLPDAPTTARNRVAASLSTIRST
jgi:hypothetical protein